MVVERTSTTYVCVATCFTPYAFVSLGGGGGGGFVQSPCGKIDFIMMLGMEEALVCDAA